jgi:hypothetical protein
MGIRSNSGKNRTRKYQTLQTTTCLCLHRVDGRGLLNYCRDRDCLWVNGTCSLASFHSKLRDTRRTSSRTSHKTVEDEAASYLPLNQKPMPAVLCVRRQPQCAHSQPRKHNNGPEFGPAERIRAQAKVDLPPPPCRMA